MDSLLPPADGQDSSQREQSQSSTETPAQKDIRENKDIAAFSYLWIMSVVIFFLRRDSPFVRFHSRQAIVLFLLSIPIWFIPFIGRILELVIFAGMVMGFISAAQGQKKDVPIIGPLSRREITIRQAWQQIVAVIAGFAQGVREGFRGAKKKDAPSSASHTPPPPSHP